MSFRSQDRRLLTVKPFSRHDRHGVQAMSDEEAYCWFSKYTARAGASRA